MKKLTTLTLIILLGVVACTPIKQERYQCGTYTAVNSGCGYIITMVAMASIREIIGNGSWMGITIIPESIDRMSLMNQAPGGFFVFGCLMALCVWIEKKLNKPIERKTCGDVMLDEIDKAKSEEGGAKE